MTHPVRPYRGVSATDRRDLRRAKLLHACLDVVATRGAAASTVDAICAAAGLSKRYFYESFSDVEALLAAALDGVLDDVREKVVAALAEAGDDVGDRARATAHALVTTLAADDRAARLYTEAPAHPVLHERRDAAVEVFAQLLVSEVIRLDASSEQARAAAMIVVAGTTEIVSRWLSGRLDLDRSAMVDTIATVGIAVAGQFSAAR